jgi:hypothetical protein
MRTIEKEINDLVKRAADLAGLSNNKKAAIEANHKSYLSYENAACYGGYRLIMIGVSNGAHYGAFNMSSCCARLKPAVFAEMLKGIIYGLEYDKRKRND